MLGRYCKPITLVIVLVTSSVSVALAACGVFSGTDDSSEDAGPSTSPTTDASVVDAQKNDVAASDAPTEASEPTDADTSDAATPICNAAITGFSMNVASCFVPKGTEGWCGIAVDAAASDSCALAQGDCKGAFVGCQSVSDCTGGESCCGDQFAFLPPDDQGCSEVQSFFSTSCGSNCSTNEITICISPTDCAKGQTCVPFYFDPAMNDPSLTVGSCQ